MKVGIHANVCDTDTQKIAFSLHEPFTVLGSALEGDYGGVMEHLWIDLELIEDASRPEGLRAILSDFRDAWPAVRILGCHHRMISSTSATIACDQIFNC